MYLEYLYFFIFKKNKFCSSSLRNESYTAKKRVIFFDSNKCNFLKHSKLAKFNQITILNVNAQNEKIIFGSKSLNSF
jgi:hypothetical protein